SVNRPCPSLRVGNEAEAGRQWRVASGEWRRVAVGKAKASAASRRQRSAGCRKRRRTKRHRPKVQGGAWCTNLTLCRTKRTRVGGVLPGVSQRKSSSRVIWPLVNSVNSLEHRFGTMPLRFGVFPHHWLPLFGFTGHNSPATRHSPLATRHSPLATRHSPLATTSYDPPPLATAGKPTADLSK